MSEIIKTNTEYSKWIKEVSLRFRNSQIKAATKVNREMLLFYWSIGHDISENYNEVKYGKSFFKNLSLDLQDALPDVKSFSVTNLKYMKYFYDLYNNSNRQQLVDDSDTRICQQAVDDCIFMIPWGHHIQIINKCKGNLDKALFFVKKTYENNWSRAVLLNFLDTNLYERQAVDDCIFMIPWGHHIQIINKCKGNLDKALFFVKKTYENNWSRAVLLNFLDTNLYEREGKAITNFEKLLPDIGSDLAREITKDPYNFDFLTLREGYDEKELKDALMDNIQKFLLELGRGFAFVGREYRLVVGDTEQFIDMLFYNIQKHCYVVIEIKTRTFDPGDMGQLGTYIAATDGILRADNDNPTIGLLICKTKDNVLAQYATSAVNVPVGISEYELNNLIPDDYKSSMPTIEEIERELKD